MMLETLMGGTQGEEAHIVYKEVDGSHLRLALIIDFMVYMTIEHSSTV